MCLSKGKPSPCGEGILPLFFAAGKMPAGRKAGTASPQTTIGMRLPHNRIDGKWVAASKPQALGMVGNERSRPNTYVGLSGRAGCVFHPGTSIFLGTFFAAVFGRYQRQNYKGIDGEYDKQNQQGQREAAY